jgi:RNA polymerase sigma factor (sigma-70 family)
MSSLLSDERLVRRAAGGEERALAAIFERYHQPLYRYCLAIVGDSQDAQDALQNTMLKVLRALPGEAREVKLKPWLYRIAHNESIDLLRRRRDTRELNAELAATGPPLAEELSVRERLRQLLSDLDQLPERQRGALVMRELAGLDFDGIATALGTSEAVARQTLYEARLGLRQMDEGRGMNCATVTKALSDGDGRVTRRRDIRAHLRACADCRHFRAEIDGRQRDFAALAPLPAAAAGGLLQALLGAGSSPGGGGAVGAAAAGGAAKAIGSSTALKGAAAVLAIAAIGTGTAERSGLIDLGLPGGGGSKAGPAQRSSGSETATDADTSASVVTGPTPRQGSASSRRDSREVGPLHVRGSAGSGPAGPDSARSNGDQASAIERPISSKGGTAHPHGQGHEKQLPAAAAHGQQTAAAHKGTSHGVAGKGHSSKPEHPSHPVHPSSGAEKAPSAPQEPSPEGGSGSPEADAVAESAAPEPGGEGSSGKGEAAQP